MDGGKPALVRGGFCEYVLWLLERGVSRDAVLSDGFWLFDRSQILLFAEQRPSQTDQIAFHNFPPKVVFMGPVSTFATYGILAG